MTFRLKNDQRAAYFCDKCYHCFTLEQDLKEHSEKFHCGSESSSVLQKFKNVDGKTCDDDRNTVQNYTQERPQTHKRYTLLNLDKIIRDNIAGEKLTNLTPDFDVDVFPSNYSTTHGIDKRLNYRLNSNKNTSVDLSLAYHTILGNVRCVNKYTQLFEENEYIINNSTLINNEFEQNLEVKSSVEENRLIEAEKQDYHKRFGGTLTVVTNNEGSNAFKSKVCQRTFITEVRLQIQYIMFYVANKFTFFVKKLKLIHNFTSAFFFICYIKLLINLAFQYFSEVSTFRVI